MRILLAEDDPVTRAILRTALEGLGHDVVAVADGNAAWAAYCRILPDVVVSDLQMPGMDGLQLCRAVREASGDRYPYLVLVTALGAQDHILQGMAAGADDYLTKPLDLFALQVRLVAAERVSRLHAQLSLQRQQLEHLNQDLYAAARTDPLTGLANRLRLAEDLSQLQARIDRYGHCYSVAMLDLDRFKEFNDTYGHAAGDQALRETGRILAANARSGDMAYRYGGEEFLLIFPEQDAVGVTAAVERARADVRGLAIPHRATPAGVVTISAGVAWFDGDGPTTEEVLRLADEALYRAKQLGRDRVEVTIGL